MCVKRRLFSNEGEDECIGQGNDDVNTYRKAYMSSVYKCKYTNRFPYILLIYFIKSKSLQLHHFFLFYPFYWRVRQEGMVESGEDM